MVSSGNQTWLAVLDPHFRWIFPAFFPPWGGFPSQPWLMTRLSLFALLLGICLCHGAHQRLSSGNLSLRHLRGGPQKRAPKKISTRNSSCGFSPLGSRWLSCWLPSFGKSLLLLVFPAPSLAKIKVEKGHHSKAGSWRVSYMPKFSGFPEAS